MKTREKRDDRDGKVWRVTRRRTTCASFFARDDVRLETVDHERELARYFVAGTNVDGPGKRRSVSPRARLAFSVLVDRSKVDFEL
jgi:hypothetical protein